ncbi:MAG: 4'-phosphopantetheinyl transferase family protein [Capsulimonadaceae bacterium]
MEKTDTVDVWFAGLDGNSARDTSYRELLDSRELARAERLSRAPDVARYVRAHGILREVLSRYAESFAAGAQYHYGPFGKPDLPGTDIRFNMSDSGGALLVAVARGVDVGVDIERRRPIDVLRFARRFFTPLEADSLNELPPDQQMETFFRMWTCKEAYVKGWGLGIRQNLRSFEVAAPPGEPSRLLSCTFDPDSPILWSLLDIPDIDGYAATVAVKSPDAALRLLRL